MKVYHFLLVFSAFALFSFNFSVGQANKADGKKLFTEYKCASCHNIESQGIVKKRANGKQPSDLSNFGGNINASQLTNYLKKKENINGKKHPLMFKGSDEDLNTLTKWLMNLKKQTPAKTGTTK